MTDAILVMESRGLVPGSRSFTISDAWTRLYKTEDYFLDISYQGTAGAERLMGQLLESSGEEVFGGGQVVLRDTADHELARTDICEAGAFNLDLELVQGASLSIELNQESFRVPNFSAE